MDFIRSNENQFDTLKDYDFDAHYTEIDAGDGTQLRVHYVDEGEGEVILCLHGQPTWSYLYRKMIPLLVDAGYRVLAPDLIGFGKSDKPCNRTDYTYARHVHWLTQVINNLNLKQINLLCQDWGSLIGLRVLAENQHLFTRVVLANGGLPDASNLPAEMAPQLRQALKEVPALPVDEMYQKLTSATPNPHAFLYWIKHCDGDANFHPAEVMRLMLNECDEEEYRAWAAPFPDQASMAGARQFPSLVPLLPDDEAIPANRRAWEKLRSFKKPFLTAFSDNDPVNKGGERRFIESIPGAQDQKHKTIHGAGHFLQDDAPQALTNAVIDFIRANPI